MSNIFTKILSARDAINAGEQLANSKTWANATAGVGAIVMLLNSVKSFLPQLEGVDEETFKQIAEGVFYLWGVISIFVHPATVKDAGLPAKRSKQQS